MVLKRYQYADFSEKEEHQILEIRRDNGYFSPVTLTILSQIIIYKNDGNQLVQKDSLSITFIFNLWRMDHNWPLYALC